MRRPWLAPFTPLYAAALALRELRIRRGWEPARRLRFPVVSIGNLSTGGAGKTPLTIALAKALTRRGLRVDVLSRGFGRRGMHTARVDPYGTAEEFGDEPILIARQTGVPVYLARQRFQAGRMAEAELPVSESSAIHLLDDGFQHRQLYRDVDLLLLNRQDLTDSLLPSGNLREPLQALNRATVFAVPADEPKIENYLREIVPPGRGSGVAQWNGPIWRLRRKMEIPPVDGPVAAFCGIAHPEQFFAGLESAGLRLAVQLAFPDHHRYTPADLSRLAAAARKAGAAALITTEKDQVRIGKLSSVLPQSLPLKTAQLQIEIENEEQAIEQLIDCLIPSPQSRVPGPLLP